MTGNEFKNLLNRYRITQVEAAQALGVSARTVFTMVHFADNEIPDRYTQCDIENIVKELASIKKDNESKTLREINIIRSNGNTLNNVQNGDGISKDRYIDTLHEHIKQLNNVIAMMERLLEDKFSRKEVGDE